MVTESDEGLPCIWVFGVVSALFAAQRGYACINHHLEHAPPRHQSSGWGDRGLPQVHEALRSCPRALRRCGADEAVTPPGHMGTPYWEAR